MNLNKKKLEHELSRHWSRVVTCCIRTSGVSLSSSLLSFCLTKLPCSGVFLTMDVDMKTKDDLDKEKDRDFDRDRDHDRDSRRDRDHDRDRDSHHERRDSGQLFPIISTALAFAHNHTCCHHSPKQTRRGRTSLGA